MRRTGALELDASGVGWGVGGWGADQTRWAFSGSRFSGWL
jgi:hypothetical protein